LYIAAIGAVGADEQAARTVATEAKAVVASAVERDVRVMKFLLKD
jgi:hypothetical protein